MLGLLTLQTEAYHCGIEQKVTQIMIQTNKLILYYKISQKQCSGKWSTVVETKTTFT